MPLYGPWAAQGADPAGDFMTGMGFTEGLRQKKQKLANETRQTDATLHQMEVQNQIDTQKQAILSHQAAIQSQAIMDYQDYVSKGGDPAKGMMLYGPGMSSGKLTGFSPFYNAEIKANQPEPKPIIQNGKIVGYSGGPVHLFPGMNQRPLSPSADPSYSRQVQEFPAVKAQAAVPAQAEVPPSFLYRWSSGAYGTPGVPAQAAKPAVPGHPKYTVTRWVQDPNAQGDDVTGGVTYMTPGGAPVADESGSLNFSSADQVKAAYKAGQIDKDTATKILQTQFGME